MTTPRIQRSLARNSQMLAPFLATLVLVAQGCGARNERPAPSPRTGPIIGIVTAASIDGRGRMREQVSFKSNAPQTSVVVQVGKVERSQPLTITWYRATQRGDEKLFSHTVGVSRFDRVYSIGRNPGVMAAGNYKAVATLDGTSKTITWRVLGDESGGRVMKASNAQVAQSEQAGPPADGGSGKITLKQGSGTSAGGCRAEVSAGPFFDYVLAHGFACDEKSERPDLAKCISLGDIAGDLEVLVRIKDAKPVVACTFSSAEIECDRDLDPCGMPGGSDLPGTEIRSLLRQKSTGKRLAEERDAINPDFNPPLVQLVSEPSNNARVKPGQKITLSGIAEEKYGWHEGVKRIEIITEAPPKETRSEEFDRYKGCDKKSLKRITRAFTYTVPASPPEKIIFCAVADDFAGNKSEADCVTLYTGDRVRGSLKASMTGATMSGGYSGMNVHETNADLSLSINADGSVTGNAHLRYSFHGEGRQDCGKTSSSTVPVEIDLPVTGSVTKTGLVFRINSDVQIMRPHVLTICSRDYRSSVPINSSARISTGQAVMEFTLQRTGNTYRGEYHWTGNGPEGKTPMTSDWEVTLQPEGAAGVG